MNIAAKNLGRKGTPPSTKEAEDNFNEDERQESSQEPSQKTTSKEVGVQGQEEQKPSAHETILNVILSAVDETKSGNKNMRAS